MVKRYGFFKPNELWRFLERAVQESEKSNCVRRKVGAYLVSPGHAHFTMTHNTTPEGKSCAEGDCPRGCLSQKDKPSGTMPYDDCIATHAEMRALQEFHPEVDMKGWVMVITEQPCDSCRLVLETRGIEFLWPTTRKETRSLTVEEAIEIMFKNRRN